MINHMSSNAFAVQFVYLQLARTDSRIFLLYCTRKEAETIMTEEILSNIIRYKKYRSKFRFPIDLNNVLGQNRLFLVAFTLKSYLK